MRIDLGAKSAIFPMPVLIIGTYDKDGNANAMNAAWGNICDYEKISIAIAKDHKTLENILETGAFTISFATVEEVIPSDFVGIISGNKDCDKIKKTGWIVEKSNKVNAPIFDKLPVTLECTLESYDEKTTLYSLAGDAGADGLQEQCVPVLWREGLHRVHHLCL